MRQPVKSSATLGWVAKAYLGLCEVDADPNATPEQKQSAADKLKKALDVVADRYLQSQRAKSA